MLKLWEEHRHRGSEPQRQKFADILDVVLETSQGEFFLIVDALDECPTAQDERSALLQFLEELLVKHPGKMHILATSRPEPDIRSRLGQYQSVNLETGLAEDVETFVHAQVANGRLSKWDESIKKCTLERLLDIPERRFHWADLQIKRLQDCKNDVEFYKALDSIPATLEDTYRDILERLSPDDREAARTILIWLSFSAVPLDLKTVAAVVSFRFPEAVVTTCTTFLVTVNIYDETVRLAHFSVKEFLVLNEAEGPWYRFSATSGHDAIANKAIDCLLGTTEILTKSTALQKPLLIYAAKYWDRHLAELGDLHINCNGLQDKVDRLFTERDVYFNWLRLANFDWDYMWHQSFEELSSPLCSASYKRLESTVNTLLAKGANPMGSSLNGNGNALLAAASGGSLEVLELLLNKVDEIPRGVTELMLWDIKIVEADKERLAAILDMLWDKGALHDQSRASKRIIDERLVERAAKNYRSGHILMDQLLERKEKMGIKITAQLLRAVMRNTGCGEDIMHLLFNKCDADVKLTPTLMPELMSASNYGAAIVILKRRVKEILVDEGSVGAFARGKKEAMELLLQERGEEIQVTQKVLVTVVGLARDPQTVRLLLNRREPGTAIDKEVLIAAAGNWSKGSEIMEMLLDECGQDSVIDEEIIQKITRNPRQGLGLIKTLLRRQQAGFVVTEQILCDAAQNHGREMLELLVNNADGSDLPITGQILRSAAKNHNYGVAVVEYLFDLRGHSLPVSEDVLVSVADVNSSFVGSPKVDDVLTFLLERWPEMSVTDRLLEAACPLPNAMGLLLDRRRDCLPIQRMIHKIATDQQHKGSVLVMLLDRQPVEVDEWLMEIVAGNSYILEVIYNRNPDFPVTPKIIVNAAKDYNSMSILLDRQKDQVLITEEVIKASLSGSDPESVISSLLTRLGPEAVPITEDILIHAIRNTRLKYTKPLELLLEQRRGLNLSAVWEAVWQDPEINPSSLGWAAGAFFQYVSFDVSEKMLERFLSEFPERYFSGYPFDDFMRSCMQHRIPLPTTEAAVELIVGRSSLNTIDIFLEDHPDIPITEKHIEAAEGNPREDVDKDALVSLLSARLS
ncbi:uncharacterized protein LDX57_008162 [Aspergillus melleus]|uniref:uncharacterized protein n=1 Tax=Aspergillus melleus TaxID=138277 RepID=UPI001E8DA5B7|nr:uncharacterized protein LDX57_008162 [Aspergillus melleus]KAH8430500.1 hypothetical protein LDX57_008162 [Aspergillus melleus]